MDDNDGPPPPPPGLYAVSSSKEPDAPSAAGEPPAAPRSAPINFLVEPRLLPAGGIHLLGGAPMAGKSTFLAQFLRQFVDPDPLFLPGMSFSKLAPEEIGVILSDRPWDRNCAWYEKVGLGEIPHYALAGDPEAAAFLAKPRPAPTGIALLKFCLERLPKTVKLVAVDVLTNGFCGGNIFHGASLFQHMNALHGLVKERGLTVLGTCYGIKLKQGKNERYQRAIDRIIGASQLRGSADSILYLEAGEETTADYQRLSWYSRHGQDQTVGLSRSPETGLFVQRRDVVLQSTPIQESPAPLELPAPRRRGPAPDPEVDAKIRSLTPLGMAVSRPGLVQELVKLGVEQRTAYRAIRRLVEAGELSLDERQGTVSRVDPTTTPEPATGDPGTDE